MGRFESTGPLAVSQVPDDPGTWETTAPLIFHSSTGRILQVPAGSRTDWASVPRLFSWLIPKLTGAAGAVGHDFAYRVLCPVGQMSYREADALLVEMLAALDRQATRWRDRIPAPTRWLVWDAVRLASVTTRRGGAEGALRDLPKMLAITIPGLLLASPAVLLIPPTALLAALNLIATKIRPKETTP